MKNFLKQACVITPNYPNHWFIESGVFVERLVKKWEEKGLLVDVIAPRSYANIFRTKFRKKHDGVNITGNRVLYPSYLSVSNKTLININLSKVSQRNFLKAIKKGLTQIQSPDFFYGQFLMTGGRAVLNAGQSFNRPAFADVGESVLIDRLSEEDRKIASNIVQSLDGIACVSKELREEVIELGADPENVMYHPNTVDSDRFQPLDKTECRNQLSLPLNEKIAIFVGHFIERKGPLRVLEAIERQKNVNLKGVFIGRGEQHPRGKSVVHAGPVPNKELPIWLNAADIFILPTIHEGHCNAINEAMACGLPIISSDIPEVRNQIPTDNGLLVNPTSIDEIASAITKLITDSELALKIGKNALDTQKLRSNKSRAEVILKWIKSKI